MPGSGTTSSNLGNVSNVSAATGYAPQLYIPNAPAVAAGAHQQHHLHPNAHHQVCLCVNCVGCCRGGGEGNIVLELETTVVLRVTNIHSCKPCKNKILSYW